MPFQVSLTPTTASPAEAIVHTEVRAAVLAEGARIAADGVTIRTADGVRFRLVRDGDNFLLDRISPSVCRIIFNAAHHTNSMVDRGGSDVVPLMMAGSKGKPRYMDIQTEVIANPQTLCVRLQRNLSDWQSFVRREQADGMMGPNEEILEPPADPGTETRVTDDRSGVPAECRKGQEVFAKSGWKILHSSVSRNPEWGVVWRADTVTREYPDILTRVVCWRMRGHHGPGGLVVSDRPLEMFDPTKSVKPLKPERAQPGK
jgi:hypothetical protein